MAKLPTYVLFNFHPRHMASSMVENWLLIVLVVCFSVREVELCFFFLRRVKNCWSFSSFLISPDKVSLYNGLSCPETHFFEEEHSEAGAASCPGLQPLRHEHTQAAFLSVFTFSLLPPFTSPSMFCKAESHTIVTVAVKDSLIFTMLPR